MATDTTSKYSFGQRGFHYQALQRQLYVAEISVLLGRDAEMDFYSRYLRL
jgi:hypothetical protein